MNQSIITIIISINNFHAMTTCLYQFILRHYMIVMGDGLPQCVHLSHFIHPFCVIHISFPHDLRENINLAHARSF